MSEPFVGQIMPVGFNFPPRGWATCDGQLLSISQNTALFSLLGTTYGGDGRTTFGLPDLRSRSAVHVGTGPGISAISWGERGGAETVALTVNHLPSHNHAATLHAHNAAAGASTPTGNALAVGQDANRNGMDIYASDAPDVDMHSGSATVANAGGGQPFNVRNPFLGIYYCIALTGIYPSRN